MRNDFSACCTHEGVTNESAQELEEVKNGLSACLVQESNPGWPLDLQSSAQASQPQTAPIVEGRVTGQCP